MITIRKANDRGHANHGWLDSYHTFSFADYYDDKFMGFGPLRVINEDRIAGGKGFGTHGHRDMEIISYVLEGAVAHKDSMGSGSVIKPGDVQLMSAGTGITHSEFNGLQNDTTHFLQIWVMPKTVGLKPSYAEKHFSDEDKRGRLRLIASENARDGSLVIHQDADVYASVIDESAKLDFTIKAGRKGWVHVARGTLAVNGTMLSAGDAIAITGEKLQLSSPSSAEFLLFDMAA